MAPTSRFMYYTPRAVPFTKSRPATRNEDDTSFVHKINKADTLLSHQAIQQATTVGDILTWTWCPVAKAVIPTVWLPPPRKTAKGAMTQYAASAYVNIPESIFNGPHCPHAINGFNLAERTLMSAHHNRKLGWYFNAEQHKCEFKLNIPPLGSKISLTSDDDADEDPNLGHWADSDDEEESFETMQLDAEAAEQVRKVNEVTDAFILSSPAPPYSPGTPAPSYPSSSPAPSTSSSPIRARPQPLNGGPRNISYRTKASAEARLCSDAEFRNLLLDKQSSGLYKKYPEQHPAWRSSLADCMPMLAQFHPQAPGAAMPQMLLMTSSNLCGQMIHQVNSAMGLPKNTFLRLLQQSLICKSCNCAYTVEGYHAHRRLNAATRELVCSNTPELVPIEELYPEMAGLYDMATRSYPLGVPLPTHEDRLNTALGRAWIAWNSHGGVTKDVWAILSTAWTHCRDCDLVRTFDGDRAHRDENFLCRDIGQGGLSTCLNSIERIGAGDNTMVVWKM
ncbi:hypothetical protein C8R47DRAFT_1117806 [Mycena vitilis]|nr:hypothetical protein C8R47DRAFT_1117806 [Mycena vitilis]